MPLELLISLFFNIASTSFCVTSPCLTYARFMHPGPDRQRVGNTSAGVIEAILFRNEGREEEITPGEGVCRVITVACVTHAHCTTIKKK